jgi:hypothetical protein
MELNGKINESFMILVLKILVLLLQRQKTSDNKTKMLIKEAEVLIKKIKMRRDHLL